MRCTLHPLPQIFQGIPVIPYRPDAFLSILQDQPFRSSLCDSLIILHSLARLLPSGTLDHVACNPTLPAYTFTFERLSVNVYKISRSSSDYYKKAIIIPTTDNNNTSSFNTYLIHNDNNLLHTPTTFPQQPLRPLLLPQQPPPNTSNIHLNLSHHHLTHLSPHLQRLPRMPLRPHPPRTNPQTQKSRLHPSCAAAHRIPRQMRHQSQYFCFQHEFVAI